MLLQTSNLLICHFVELPFKNGIFEYPFIKSVKSDIRIWFLYIRIWYDIRISKLHSNIIIIFEYGNNIRISKSYDIRYDNNIRISNFNLFSVLLQILLRFRLYFFLKKI